ncbi:MAG: vWA domain-containing protein [Candidatus Thiodiazotropha sp.]
MISTLSNQKSKFHTVAVLLSILTLFLAQASWAETQDNNPAQHPVVSEADQRMPQPRIQLAILLDTSNSMDGLIDQARNQLWRIVDEFSKARREGVPALLEVAIFEYGNDSLDAEKGYIRKVTDLTSDLDRVSEALFSLTTNGGKEYCGHAIMSATDQLQWSVSDNEIKAIFIAGNEPFTQGPIAYRHAIEAAKASGITVNTIHAGSHEEGLQTGWNHGALLAGGDYMSIDHNRRIAHITAPQDRRIAALNRELNQTYIPYGSKGKAGKERQLEQDMNSNSVSPALLSKRTKSKAGALYNNSQWDLIDAIQEDKVNLEHLGANELPTEMSDMDMEQRERYISAKAAQRTNIKKEIADLSKAREAYVTEQRLKAANQDTTTLNDALTSSIRKQGKAKNYQFLEN